MDIHASDLGFLEGPVVCQDGSLVVTSIDRGKVYRITDDKVELLAVTGGGPNGATEGPDGAIYVAQNGGTAPALNHVHCPAGVQIIEKDGSIRHFGTMMRSPNDLCFGPDGQLYVTDPTRTPTRDDGRVWRCDLETHTCERILTCDWYPNGIGFAMDGEWLYVADSRHRRIVRMTFGRQGRQCVETFLELDHGAPDGFAFDEDGNLLIACPNFGPEGGDVQVYRNCKLVEVLRPGTSKYYTNLAISDDGTLYLCDSERGMILKQTWGAGGLPLYPFRSNPEP